MLFSTWWLSTLFSNCMGEVSKNKMIKSVSIDSRTIEDQTLFIPLSGENFDGHSFAEHAIQKGAIALLWDESLELPPDISDEVTVFFVKDTLVALQQLAQAHRNVIDPFVIGITGSNGKTTTKDIVTSIAQTTYKTYGTIGNFNNHIGLPLTMINMPANTEVLVLEMGMNNFGEIEQLSKLAQPDIGVIVNIGESHIEFLKTREGIAQAKLEIKEGLKEGGYLIIDGDEPLLQHLHDDQTTITCGYAENNDLVIKAVEQKAFDETTFKLSSTGKYSLPLIGNYNILNATFAIAVAKRLNIKRKAIQEGLSHLQLTSMRMELSYGKNGVTIINDAYNASPTSMKAAIDTVKKMPNFTNKVLVLGDILELGDFSEPFHREVARDIQSPITAVLTYGKQAKIIAQNITDENINTNYFDSTTELIEQLQPYLQKDTVILFKASRGMQFENLVKAIQ